MLSQQVVIIGAGLSGLIAANQFAQNGTEAVVLEKATSAGGRLATRRLPTDRPNRLVRADHGAQFFTVRSPDFADLVHEWRRAGLVREWCKGFVAGGDGHPRYCAEGGMNTIAKYLASTVDVRTNTKVNSITARDGWWTVESDTDQWTASVVVLSPPVPQSLALLDAGGIRLSADVRKTLDGITYGPCLALIVTLDGPSDVPEPGGVQLTDTQNPMFSFVGDNSRKGISDAVTLTCHVHDVPSRELFDVIATEPDRVTRELIDAAQRWIGSSRVIGAQVHRWRYARPLTCHDEPYLWVEATHEHGSLAFIGDAFGPAKVEGAALSGLALSSMLR